MSRAAMQQALEALEKATRFMSDSDYKKLNQAIDDLRAALAEPEPIEDVVVYGSAWSKDGKRIDPMSVYKEPEQKGWFTVKELNEWATKLPQTTHWEGCEAVHPECRKPDTDCHAQGICQRSGYSIAPTPRTPLTDEEIADLWDGHTVPVFGKIGINPIVFAHAIERAHGIKN